MTLSPASRALSFCSPISWGSATLHPRLYAFSALRGLNEISFNNWIMASLSLWNVVGNTEAQGKPSKVSLRPDKSLG
jgi:hypothetical protein